MELDNSFPLAQPNYLSHSAEQEDAGLLRLLVAGGRSLGYKAVCVVGAGTP